MTQSRAGTLCDRTSNAIVFAKLEPNCALVAMCDVVTAKFGVGGGVGDLHQGLTHIQKRLGEPVTPLGGDADLERLRDPEDPGFDDLELRDATAEALPGTEDTQVSFPTGLLGLTLTLLTVHLLAAQWLVRFPLPVMRDFEAHFHPPMPSHVEWYNIEVINALTR
jgi:hypothetical protein